jgi:acyl-CoA dehydrogenase
VGEEDRGWTVAKYLLEFERGGGGTAAQQSALARVRRLAASVPAGEGTLLEDSDFRRKLDATEVELEAVQHTELRIMAALSQGQNPGPESSIMKNLSANLGQRITELSLEAVGTYAVPHQPWTPGGNLRPLGGEAAATALPRYFNLRASSIAGGTNEVQKNIVAKLVLGL